MCWGRHYRDYWISWLINPSTGRKFEWGGDCFTPAAQPKSVLVIGGGVAGLEATRVAAERGHHVTLAEASDKLGGKFRLAGLTPRRQRCRSIHTIVRMEQLLAAASNGSTSASGTCASAPT